MMDLIVNLLFKWNRLREAIFNEVHFYDMIDDRIKNIDDIGSAHWNDGDGWRFWTFNKELNRYYFDDIPNESFVDSFQLMMDKYGKEMVD